MTFKVVKQLNPIDAMKILTKPNYNLCMQEHSTMMKKLRDKRVTVMNNNSEIYGPSGTKRIFIEELMISFLTGERVRPLRAFQILLLETINGRFEVLGNGF